MEETEDSNSLNLKMLCLSSKLLKRNVNRIIAALLAPCDRISLKYVNSLLTLLTKWKILYYLPEICQFMRCPRKMIYALNRLGYPDQETWTNTQFEVICRLHFHCSQNHLCKNHKNGKSRFSLFLYACQEVLEPVTGL